MAFFHSILIQHQRGRQTDKKADQRTVRDRQRQRSREGEKDRETNRQKHADCDKPDEKKRDRQIIRHKESHGFHGIIYVKEQDTVFHPGRGAVRDLDLTSGTRPTNRMLVPDSVTFAGTTGQLGTTIFSVCSIF